MRGRIGTLAILGLLVGGLALPEPARAAEAEVVQQILGILKDRGIVDDAQYQQLASDYAASQSKGSWLDRFQISGDFRARHESFWFDDDAFGVDADNRYRGRYRVRLGIAAEVNEWASVHLRLASGEDDLRSTNTSFGQDDADFDPDGIFIDRAYVALAAPDSWFPVEGGRAELHVGKQGNPFTWKVGKDFMLWDGDVNPEGVGLRLSGEAGVGSWFLHSGYFVLDENSGAKDPHVFGAQLGGELPLGSDSALGARATWYDWRSLDSSFIGRGVDGTGGSTSAGGNIADGLTGNAAGGDFEVGEIGAYLTWKGSEDFPVTLYGNVSKNFDAEASVASIAGAEDMAWGVGVEVGDKKRLALLGVGYWEIEANAFPAQFVDSDLFDGFTNRKGWAFYGSRQIFKNTDLNLTLFLSDEIEDGGGPPAAGNPFAESVSGAERLRLQTDVVFKF